MKHIIDDEVFKDVYSIIEEIDFKDCCKYEIHR